MKRDLVPWALSVAAQELEATAPQRWSHVRSAVELARDLAPMVGDDADLLIAAVALHDIGFAPGARKVGFSLIDGAEHLRELGAAPRLVNLVAHHAYAALEARLRGLGGHYTRFGDDERTPVRDALWYCCLTTGPDGRRMTLEERFAEWMQRYDDDVIPRYIEQGRGEFTAVVDRIEAKSALLMNSSRE